MTFSSVEMEIVIESSDIDDIGTFYIDVSATLSSSGATSDSFFALYVIDPCPTAILSTPPSITSYTY
jgi:hypothetical protein